MELDLNALPSLIQALGVVGLMGLALVGAYKRWYVFRPEFDDERADKLEWKAIALEALKVANTATNVAEKVSDVPPKA